jgi:hypothetical protein
MGRRRVTQGLLIALAGALALAAGCDLNPHTLPPNAEVATGADAAAPQGPGSDASQAFGDDGGGANGEGAASQPSTDASAGSDGVSGDAVAEGAAADGPTDAPPDDGAGFEGSDGGRDASVPETSE